MKERLKKNTARPEGYAAAWDCYAFEANPYDEGAPFDDLDRRTDWALGWIDGDKEMKEGNKNEF